MFQGKSKTKTAAMFLNTGKFIFVPSTYRLSGACYPVVPCSYRVSVTLRAKRCISFSCQCTFVKKYNNKKKKNIYILYKCIDMYPIIFLKAHTQYVLVHHYYKMLRIVLAKLFPIVRFFFYHVSVTICCGVQAEQDRRGKCSNSITLLKTQNRYR